MDRYSETGAGRISKVWVDEIKWNMTWSGHEEVGQGGQGVARRVTQKETETVGCLKLLSKQRDAERRLRFAREATAYDTCRHPLIPGPLASNAHNHADSDCKLFIMTEFIPRPTLIKRIEERALLGWEDGVDLVSELLMAVLDIHGNQLIHRDIKPDNIILPDGN
jgi:serine/threonine-protein kinase